MRKLFKRIIKLFVLLSITLILLTFLNNETDILSDFERYVPDFKYSYIVEDFSNKLSSATGGWPTFEQMYADVTKHLRGAEDIAVNEYIKDSPLVSFYPNETIGIRAEADSVTVYGKTNDEKKVNFVAIFNDDKGDKLSQTSFAADSDMEFSKKIPYPETSSDRISLGIYYSPKAYGEYRSWSIEYLYFVRDASGVFAPEESEVYSSNTKLYESEKSIKNSLRASGDILSSNEDLKAFTEQIISNANAKTDYEKILAIHDWICDNIYYDQDSLTRGQYPPYNPIEVINTKRGVCKGFAYLFASMTRSCNIPCTIVSGYALGIDGIYDWQGVSSSNEQNHAWNEAYVDGRWVIVDTTWDCGNKIENSELISEGTSHIFFDANLRYFSNNHKIVQYFYK